MKNTILSLLAAVVLIGSASAQVPTGDFANGLVAYYSFSGNANDVSGNGNNGTPQGATLTTDRFNNANSAYYFNGSSWIETSQYRMLDGASEATISAWVTINANTDPTWGGQLVSAGDFRGGIDPICARFTGTETSQVNFQDCAAGNNPSDAIGNYGGPFNLGDLSLGWHQLVIVLGRDNPLGSFRVYVDSTLKVEVFGCDDGSSSFGKISYDTDMRFLIGALEGRPFYSTPAQFWIGNIDEVGIWNTALPSQQVSQLYTLQSAPEPSTYALLGIGAIGMLVVMLRKMTT